MGVRMGVDGNMDMDMDLLSAVAFDVVSSGRRWAVCGCLSIGFSVLT